MKWPAIEVHIYICTNASCCTRKWPANLRWRTRSEAGESRAKAEATDDVVAACVTLMMEKRSRIADRVCFSAAACVWSRPLAAQTWPSALAVVWPQKSVNLHWLGRTHRANLPVWVVQAKRSRTQIEQLPYGKCHSQVGLQIPPDATSERGDIAQTRHWASHWSLAVCCVGLLVFHWTCASSTIGL